MVEESKRGAEATTHGASKALANTNLREIMEAIDVLKAKMQFADPNVIKEFAS